MKSGIYKRRDNGKHIYVRKDRSIGAFELSDCHDMEGELKVSESERGQVVLLVGQYWADRVADVPKGVSDCRRALQQYVDSIKGPAMFNGNWVEKLQGMENVPAVDLSKPVFELSKPTDAEVIATLESKGDLQKALEESFAMPAALTAVGSMAFNFQDPEGRLLKYMRGEDLNVEITYTPEGGNPQLISDNATVTWNGQELIIRDAVTKATIGTCKPCDPYKALADAMTSGAYNKEREIGMPAALGAGFKMGQPIRLTESAQQILDQSARAEQIVLEGSEHLIAAMRKRGFTVEQFQDEIRIEGTREQCNALNEELRAGTSEDLKDLGVFQFHVKREPITVGLPREAVDRARASLNRFATTVTRGRMASNPPVAPRRLSIIEAALSQEETAYAALRNGEFRLCGKAAARKHKKRNDRHVWWHPVFQSYAWRKTA